VTFRRRRPRAAGFIPGTYPPPSLSAFAIDQFVMAITAGGARRRLPDAPRRELHRQRRNAGGKNASYRQFRSSIMDWTDISERAYLNSRALA
jgi:hypothetical protein